MKTEMSKLPLYEAKHFLGVFLQMGRVQLDSDWNEQSEGWLRLLQRHAADVVRAGSPNLGFRVGRFVLLDALDARAGWKAEPATGDPAPKLFVDYFQHHTGRGSLTVEGAVALKRTLRKPLDLTGVREFRFLVRGTFPPGSLKLFLKQGANEVTLACAEAPSPWPDWHELASDTVPAGFDLAAVEQYGFTGLDKSQRYAFDFLEADLPIRVVAVPTSSASAFKATPFSAGDVPRVDLDDDHRIWKSVVLRVGGAGSVTHAFPAPRDLRRARKLILAARLDSAASPVYDVKLKDASDQEWTLTTPDTASSAGWVIRSYQVPKVGAGFDWSKVVELEWTLSADEVYLLSPVLQEMAAGDNLVIMGGDGTSAGAGRFYGDGLSAVKESHETYFSQADLPEPDAAAFAPLSANDKNRADLVYLDLWERPVTFIEDPDLREVALEGPDTCTRSRLMAQVRILKGDEAPLGTPAEPPKAVFEALRGCGKGTLTTKDKPGAAADPCADPCEPEVKGPFLGEENSLFRIEVHRWGGIGPAGDPATALFKWSRENASVASPLLETAEVGATSLRVERPELFRPGDLIEVSSDLVDVITGPYEDTVDHRRHEAGELRRITSVNLQDKRISWEDAGAPDPEFHAGLSRSQRKVYHARIRRWEDVRPVTPGDLVLADGVVIEFGGSDLRTGDYWQFTTRVVDRSVELLIEEPPRGTCHRYYELAVLRRASAAGKVSLAAEDRRPRFHPLTGLEATDVAFDPARCADACGCTVGEANPWDQVENVQEAIEALCRSHREDELKLHNRLLHGTGVVCGLKVRCNPEDRTQVLVGKGYALDCEGCGILLDHSMPYGVVAEAKKKKLLDNKITDATNLGSGHVCLTIARGVGEEPLIGVESKGDDDFWSGVLEGTLIKDFYDHCLKNILDFLKAQFGPFPDNAVPASEANRRLISVINLYFELLNSASGQYVFLSRAEHDILKKLYEDLKALLGSKTFCAMFDGADQFPEYPYDERPGIDTYFGHFLTFHRRIRLRPESDSLYTCGSDDAILVFDRNTGELRHRLLMPGGVEVQDVAFNADGTEMYAVGILNDTDSVFVTATIAADGTHSFGPPLVVCDTKFVTLGTHPNFQNTLYAIAKGKGLYGFNPANIPLKPTPKVAFNATGILRISPDGQRAFVGQNSNTTADPTNFDQIGRIDLSALNPTTVTTYLVEGKDDENDVAHFGDWVYVTGIEPITKVKTLYRFGLNGGQQQTQLALPQDTCTRLALLKNDEELLVTLADGCDAALIVKLGSSPMELKKDYRIPLQGFPMDLVVDENREHVYAVNGISCTVSAVAVDPVITTPPVFTMEPPLTLSQYRSDIIDAFNDVLSKFGQYLKDCFCDHFLVECPECDEDDRVYLGCVEIQNGKVFNICNFEKRHYVKTFRTWSYWLSTVPILPLVKRLFAQFCCMVLP